MLLKSGAQPNVRQQDGRTSLHIAARVGNCAMVHLLLVEGADAQLKSKVGAEPYPIGQFCMGAEPNRIGQLYDGTELIPMVNFVGGIR